MMKFCTGEEVISISDEKFRALVKRAQELANKVESNSKELEEVKAELAAYKKPKKKKDFWGSLLGDDDENDDDKTGD